jgi:transglutaminase-like putative cysteine protease
VKYEQVIVDSLVITILAGPTGLLQLRQEPAATDAEPAYSSCSCERVASIEARYKIHPEGRVAEHFRLTLLVPLDVPDAQHVHSVEILPPPRRLFEHEGNRYAEFYLRRVSEPIEVRFEAVIGLVPRHLSALSSRRDADSTRSRTLDDAARREYLAVERMIEHQDPEVRNLSNQIQGSTRLARLRSAMELVCESLEYHGLVEEERGAARALSLGTGDCNDYSDLLIAILRADGIPARAVGGVLSRGGDAGGHGWVDAWAGDEGWVRLDPLMVDRGRDDFGVLAGDYVTLTTKRSDSIISPGAFFRWVTDIGRVKLLWDLRVTTRDAREGNHAHGGD